MTDRTENESAVREDAPGVIPGRGLGRRIAPLLVILFLCLPLFADFRDFAALPVDPEIEQSLAKVAEETLAVTPKLSGENLSLTVIDLDRGVRGSFRPETGYHPASVVKMFFLVAAHYKLQKGEIRRTDELQRAMRDMIVESSNDATNYIVDLISGTTGGPELEGRAYRKFYDRRMWVNRYFGSLGYTIQASGKTWGDGPFGREKQLLGKNRENRNRFTSEQPAALLYDIVRRKAVSASASGEMLALLKRGLGSGKSTTENQVDEFLGAAMPEGTKQWSKAGWTSEVRHDAVYVELPSGRRLIFVVLTRGNSADVTTIPQIGKRLLERFDRPL